MKNKYYILLVISIGIIFSCGKNDPISIDPKDDSFIMDTTKTNMDTIIYEDPYVQEKALIPECDEDFYCNCYDEEHLQFRLFPPLDPLLLDSIVDIEIIELLQRIEDSILTRGYYSDSSFYVTATINGMPWAANFIFNFNIDNSKKISASSLTQSFDAEFGIQIGGLNLENNPVSFSAKYNDFDIPGYEYFKCPKTNKIADDFFEIDAINYGAGYMEGRFEFTVAHKVEDFPKFIASGLNEAIVLEVRDGRFRVKFEQ